ncbi:MAG: hypothetical protein F6K53_23665 [Moorea sp. SIO4A1]|uniref:hypothetical protein n=1 Tax=Moorena sp. SIO4A1 TaxID=2607835 RepID=UPI0013CAA17B|nr:hypothetical protein [Moorena sp. SIO4A1]NEO18248.1 hypothetical protein [Moorena sp. SIO4A5]NEQ60244.1 hypothetical protein [Moorena sp. SIO4A1]
MIYQMIYLGQKATLREQVSSLIKEVMWDLLHGSQGQLLCPNYYSINPSKLYLKYLITATIIIQE